MLNYYTAQSVLLLNKLAIHTVDHIIQQSVVTLDHIYESVVTIGPVNHYVGIITVITNNE